MGVQDLIRAHAQLVSLPDVCLQIQQLADDPDCSIDAFARAVSQDPALTARLLKLVNSAHFGVSGRVDTVSRAVRLAGIRQLCDLTLATAAIDVFHSLPNDLCNVGAFWRHSLFCALVASALARECGVLHAERLFTAGLLHDIGRLLIFRELPGPAAEILNRAAAGAEDLCTVERAVLGFDHAQAGAALLAHWDLPPELCAAVGAHHAPGDADRAPLEAALVHIANAVTECIEAGMDSARDPLEEFLAADRFQAALDALASTEIAAPAWSRTGLAVDELRTAAIRAADGFDERLAALYVHRL